MGGYELGHNGTGCEGPRPAVLLPVCVSTEGTEESVRSSERAGLEQAGEQKRGGSSIQSHQAKERAVCEKGTMTS